MKIAQIVCTFPPYKGGMGNSVYQAALALGQRGHEVTIFTPAYNQETNTEQIAPNVKVIRLAPLFCYGSAAVLPQLFYLLKGFDIIHLHYPFYGSADIVVLTALVRRLKIILHYHMDSIEKGIKGLIFKFYSFFFLPILVRLTTKITCASLDYIKYSKLADFYLNHKDMFIEVSFGVDIKKFFPRIEAKKSLILFVGGLDKQHYFKGVPQLIEAVSKILPTKPEVKLVLVGSGNLEKYYQTLAKEKGIIENFKIINKASDEELANWYNQAQVLVLPSTNKSEAFGLVLLEAMSSGIPVIASNLSGVRNVFKNKQHGFLVKPGDVHELINKISYLLNNPDQAKAMGLAARHYVEEHYSWNKVAERLEAVYFRTLYVPPKKL